MNRFSSSIKRSTEEKQALTENPSFEGSAYNTFTLKTDQNDDTEMDLLKKVEYHNENEVINFNGEIHLEELDNISVASNDDNEKKLDESLNATLPSSRMRRLRTNTIRSRSLKRKSSVDETDFKKNLNQVSFLEPFDNAQSSIPSTSRIRQHSTAVQYHSASLGRWQHFKLEIAMKWFHFKQSVASFFSFFKIWRGHMKEVEGMFGTGVLSYFVLLRWLLLLNLLVSCILVSFLFVPQIISLQSTKTNNVSFTGLELLTGEGWFTNSELFYGTYTNKPVKSYELQYAYLIVGGGYIFIVIVIMAISMAKSYNQNYIFSGEKADFFSSKVFCSWDFTITNLPAAKIKSQSIAQDLLETLGSERDFVNMSCNQWCYLIFIRSITNVIALAFKAGSIYLIIFVSDLEKVGNQSTITAMLPAITISSINLIMPLAFRLIASIESYQFAENELQITLLRTTVLKLASLIAYVIALHKKLSIFPRDFCWETFAGQAFYKLVIVDFISLLISILFGEFIRNAMATYIKIFKVIGRPGFDISRNVLDLIYGQGLCWLGTFYCPLLPVIHVLKLFITFYAKKFSIVLNCRPTMRPFKAKKMNLVFLVLLSFMLIFSLVVTGYIIMNEDKLKPSTRCGPFRGQSSIYKVVSNIVAKLPGILKNIVQGVSSAAVIATIAFLMFLVAYYFRMKKLSCEKKIKLMEKQIHLAGQDKQYLMIKLRHILKENAHFD